MPLLTDTMLAKSIRENTIENVYYFYGRDVSSLEKYASRLASKLTDNSSDSLNFHKLDGRKLSMSELWDCCNMLPCFADRICIMINDLNADSLSKDDFEYLCGVISDLPDTTTVIIYATGVDLYKNKKYLTDKNEKLNKLCQKVGHSCEFSFKTPADLSKTIITKAEKQGCTISKQNATYLAEKCLCEQAFINSELEKLMAFAQGREITYDDIEALCVKRLDSDSFKLTSLILKGNANEAFSLIDELYDRQLSTLAIIGSMSNSFFDIYRARTAMSNAKDADDIVRDFSYPKNREFAVKNALRDCRNISDERIRRCVTALADADNEAKFSRMDDRIILERAVSVMLRK